MTNAEVIAEMRRIVLEQKEIAAAAEAGARGTSEKLRFAYLQQMFDYCVAILKLPEPTP